MAMSPRTALGEILPVLRGHRRVYFGWWLVAVGVVLTAITSGTSFWAFGLYIEPVEDEFGWSRATVSFGFALSLLLSGVAAPFVGRAIDVYGPRRVTLLGAALTSGTFFLVATTSAVWEWYLFLTINAVVRQMMFYIPLQALASRWFERRRGMAVGILATGFSLGGVVMAPVLRVVMDSWDWEGGLIFSGALLAAIYLPLGWVFIRDHPSDVGQYVDGDPAPREPRGDPRPLSGLTVWQAMRTPLLWALGLALAMLFFGMVGWTVHMLPYFESVGVSAGGAAALVSLAAGAAILGRLGFAVVADRVPRMESAAMVLTVLLMAAMMTLLISGGSGVGIAVFLLFFLVGASGGPMIEPLLLARSFGQAHFATILGVTQIIGTLGMVVSPTVAGAIFDRTASYDWALVMFAAAFGASMLLFLVARRLPRPVIPEPLPQPRAAAAASRIADAAPGGGA